MVVRMVIPDLYVLNFEFGCKIRTQAKKERPTRGFITDFARKFKIMCDQGRGYRIELSEEECIEVS